MYLHEVKLFNLASNDILNLDTAWTACCRRTVKLHNRSHLLFKSNNMKYFNLKNREF